SLAALIGRALISFRAGLALSVVGSFVNGLIPSRAFVAGFLITTNFARPGTRNAPDFLSSLYAIVASPSRTSLTSFLLRPSDCPASFSINSDFDIRFAIGSSPWFGGGSSRAGVGKRDERVRYQFL